MKKYLVLLLVLVVAGCGFNRKQTNESTAIANEVFTKRSIAQDYRSGQEQMARTQAVGVMKQNFTPMWVAEYQTQPIVKEVIIATMAVPLAITQAAAYDMQTLKFPVFFTLGDYVLDSVARQTLQAKADILNSNNRVVITIIGRASGKGDIAYNTKLSKLRAEMCKQYLIAQNINPNRILTTYRGESDAIKEGLHEDQRADFSPLVVQAGMGINPPPEGPGPPVSTQPVPNPVSKPCPEQPVSTQPVPGQSPVTIQPVPPPVSTQPVTPTG